MLFFFSWNRNNAAYYTTRSWHTPTRVDERDGMRRRRVRAAASLLFFFWQRRLKAIPLRVSWVVRGNPKMARAEKGRRCSYRSLECILCVLGLSLCSCGVWEIQLVEIGLATAMILLEAPPPRHAVLWSVGVGAVGASVAIR